MKRLFVLAMAVGGLLLFGMQDAQAASGAVNRLKRDLDNCVLYYKSSSQKWNTCIDQAADRAYKGNKAEVLSACQKEYSQKYGQRQGVDVVIQRCAQTRENEHKASIAKLVSDAKTRAKSSTGGASSAEIATVRKSCDGYRSPYREWCLESITSCGNVSDLRACVNDKLKARIAQSKLAPKPQPAVQPAAPKPAPKPQPAVQPAAPKPAPKPQPAKVQPPAPVQTAVYSSDPRAARDILDAAFYLGKYPDLRKAFGADLARATQHWLSFGIGEGRQSSPTFSVQAYLNRYPDLQRAFGPRNYPAAVQHWVNFGRNEKRNPRP